VSPTVFRHKGYRFFFFSREEERIHVHVESGKGEAKFWLEPSISIAMSYGLAERDLQEVGKIIKEKENEIRNSWKEHFPGGSA